MKRQPAIITQDQLAAEIERIVREHDRIPDDWGGAWTTEEITDHLNLPWGSMSEFTKKMKKAGVRAKMVRGRSRNPRRVYAVADILAGLKRGVL